MSTITRPCSDLPASDKLGSGIPIQSQARWIKVPCLRCVGCLTMWGALNIYLSRRMWQAAAIDCPVLSKTSDIESQKLMLCWYGEAFCRITEKSHKDILACLYLRLCAEVSKALNQRIGFPSIPLRLANRPNLASLPQETTHVLKTIALPGHAPNLDL